MWGPVGQQPLALTHLHVAWKGSRMKAKANREQENYFATKTLIIIIAYASEQMPQLIMIRII